MSEYSGSTSSTSTSKNDSTSEELESLKRTSSVQGLHSNVSSGSSRGFFRFGRKSYSTNSSPIKGLIETKTYEKEDQTMRDAVPCSYDDITTLNYDPFYEENCLHATGEPETPSAGSTEDFENSAKKSVRFINWDQEAEELLARKELKKRKRGKFRLPSKFNLSIQHSLSSGQRHSSSEYSETPDTTGAIPEDNNGAYSITQLQSVYKLLPNEFEDLLHQQETLESYNPDLNESSKSEDLGQETSSKAYEPLSSNSTNEQSVFSKNNSPTEPSSTIDDSTIRASKVFVEGDATIRPLKKIGNPSESESRKFETAASLAKRFKNLSLQGSETDCDGDVNVSEGTSTINNTRNPKGRPFSLKLFEDSKNRSTVNDSNELSLDNMDILDIEHPQIPTVEDMLKADKSVEHITTTPLFKSVNEVDFNSSGTTEQFNRGLSKKVTSIAKILSHLSGDSSSVTSQPYDECDNLDNTVSLLEKLAMKSDERVNSIKIDSIKYQKQLKDSELALANKEKNYNSMRKKLNAVISEMESLKLECSRYESRLNSQQNSIHFEQQTNREYEKEFLEQKKQILKYQKDSDENEAFVDTISRLVARHDSKECTENASMDQLVESLKKLLSEGKSLKDTLQDERNAKGQLLSNFEDLSVQLERAKREHDLSVDFSNILKQENEKLNSLMIQKDCNAEELTLKIENLQKSLISLRSETSDVRKQLENEKFRGRELLEQLDQVSKEKLQAHSKIGELDKILSEQLLLIQEAHKEIEEQSGELSNSQEQLHKSNQQYQQLLHQHRSLKTTLTSTQNELENVNDQNEQLEKDIKELEKQKNRAIKCKNEELNIFKAKVSDLEQLNNDLSIEISDTRARLSEKFTECSTLEKKADMFAKTSHDKNDNNKLLRSDILRNKMFVQDLKRALMCLSVSALNDFEGILDNESISVIKKDLDRNLKGENYDTEESQLERFNDITAFIEEAIKLVVKEYWALTKRLNELQKRSISDGSLTVLQRILDVQTEKLKKSQEKVQYYEGLLKKIGKINGKSTVSLKASAASLRNSEKSDSSEEPADFNTVRSRRK